MLSDEMVSAVIRVHSVVVLICITSIVGGCNRRPAAVPASQPSRPTTLPTSEVVIDGKTVALPAGRLIVQLQDSIISAHLYSESPEAAPGYLFDMDLDGDDPDHLDEAKWTFQTESRARGEPASALFLDGDKRQFQPIDVHGDFQPIGSQVIVRIAGNFAEFDEEEDKPRRLVPLAITLVAQRQHQ